MHFDLTRRFQSHPWQTQMKQRERKVTNRKEKKGKTSRKSKYHQTQIFSMLAEFVSKTSQASHVFCGNANRWLSFATKTYLWVLIIRFYIQHHLRRRQSWFLFRNPQILDYSSNKLTLFISKFHWTFVSEQKLRQNSALWSTELSLKKPRIIIRTFARNFNESLVEQNTKFVHFPCVTFTQYCTFNI